MIKESAELALSWVKTHSYDLGITNKRAQDPLRIPDAIIDVPLHLPAGAQKKGGPSAGVVMVRIQKSLFLRFGLLTEGIDRSATVSLLMGKCVPLTTAITDEVRVSVGPHNVS